MYFNSTKKILTALLLSAPLCLPTVAQAANLISIIVADTKDITIGNTVKVDFDNMRNTISEVAKYTQLNSIEINLEGNETTPTNLLKKLEDLTIDPDDVVVFYFAGHGYHLLSEQNGSPWPNLYFCLNGQGVHYDTVFNDLEKKNPRLLLSIADVCNNLLPDNRAPLRARALIFEETPEYVREHNYKQLFLEATGSIRIASASVGEFSWGGPNGGVFTRSFIKSIKDSVKSTNGIDWNSILDESYNQTTLLTSKKNSTQHPYFEININ